MVEHKWSQQEYVSCLSRETVGDEIGKRIAGKLKSGKSLYNQHRDYCGHGLTFADDKYCVVAVYDGSLECKDIIASFENEQDFVSFISRQSDYTLAGASKNESAFYTEDTFLLNNQRLTKKVLGQFAGTGT